jgi:hypothetical protein
MVYSNCESLCGSDEEATIAMMRERLSDVALETR